MGEFETIRDLFRPLTSGLPGSDALRNDGAELSVPCGMALGVTSDTLIESVHFVGNEPAALLAQKALAVNLSDLAAQGAQPYAYSLCLSLPRHRAVDRRWLEDFCKGLQASQQQYGITLCGGDTTVSPHGLTITISAYGLIPAGQSLRRAGANAGDAVYVSGTIGDAGAGLAMAQGRIATVPELLARYQLPQPRITLGLALRGVATACLDVSDGLVADAGHIATESGVQVCLWAEMVPVHSANSLPVEQNITAGDDYELLFTINAGDTQRLEKIAQGLNLSLTRIGYCKAGEGVRVYTDAGEQRLLRLAQHGFRHF